MKSLIKRPEMHQIFFQGRHDLYRQAIEGLKFKTIKDSAYKGQGLKIVKTFFTYPTGIQKIQGGRNETERAQ